MKKNRGVSMITVVITIVVILILAMIAFGSSGDVIDNTDYSKFVNNLSEVGNAFDNASVDIQGSSMLVNNKKRDEQIYNFIAKGGQKEKDFLVVSKVPDYTIIQDSAEIGMDLPEMKIESGTGKMVAVKYVTTKTGEIFIWPPYEYGGKLYITETDTVDHKMQTNISVGGKDFVIELDPEWGSIIDKVVEETETPEPDYEEPSEEGHEHDFSAKEATADYFCAEATCTTSEKYYYKCLYCEEKGTTTYNSGNPLDHEYGEFTIIAEGNCGGAGSKKRVCLRCSNSEIVTIPKNSANHIGGEVSEMKTVASCVSAGVEEIKCKTCGVVFRTNNLDKNPNNHGDNIASETTVKPTCTTTGTKVEKCSACGKTTKTETINALGHSWGDYVVGITANCMSKGTKERTCSVCKVKETIETDVDASNHTGGTTEKEIKDATCTSDGEIISKCSLCKATLDSQKIAAKGHNFTNKTQEDKYLKTEANCVAAAVYYFKCSACDTSGKTAATPDAYTYSVGNVDTTNHVGNIEEHYTAPTEQSEGRKWTTCDECNGIVTEEIIPKISAKVVYSADDNSLRFYKNSDVIVAGEDYNGRVATHVYTGVETAHYEYKDSKPWYSVRENILKVIIEDEIKPVSTANWFSELENCTEMNLAKLDTSEVTNMRGMFESCIKIPSIDVSKFDTKNVTDMSRMFLYCYEVNALNVSNFETGNVLDMNDMFQDCDMLETLDLSNFDTSKVKNMAAMFAGLTLENLDVSNFDTTNVENFCFMFAGCTYLKELDVSKFSTSNAVYLTGMFRGCNALKEIDIADFETSKVTEMSELFIYCYNVTELDLSNWDTTKVTNMQDMFLETVRLNKVTLGEKFSFKGTNGYLPAPSGDYITGADGNWYEAETGAKYAPSEIPNNVAATYVTTGQDVMLAANSTWYSQGGTTINRNQISSITIADTYSTTGKTIVDQWDASVNSTGTTDNIGPITAYVEDDGLGNGTYKLTLAGNGSGKVYANEDSSYVFGMPPEQSGDAFVNLTTINGAEKLDTSNAKTFAAMFLYARKLATIDVSKWNTENVTNLICTFSYCTSLESLDLSKWDVGNVTSMSYMLATYLITTGPMKLTTIGDVSNWDTSKVTDMYCLFQGCQYIEELNVGKWDTSKVENMRGMFAYCDSLTELDVATKTVTANGKTYTAWNTGNVKTFRNMFCTDSNAFNGKITKLEVENWDTSSCEDMRGMFNGCAALTELDLSGWDVSKVTDMEFMFADCRSMKTYDFTGWDTSNVTTFNCLFNDNQSLVTIDVSDFDTQNVTRFTQVFELCRNLESIIGLENWDTSSGVSMFQMFNNSPKIKELDLSSFDTISLINICQMFGNCHELEKIYVSEKWDISKLSENTFVVDDVTPSGCKHHVFWNCYKLVGGAGTAYTDNHLSYSNEENSADYIYAHIDEGSSNPGYLTDIEMKSEPVLSANSTWYSQGGTTINRSQITSITIADTYDTTGKTVVDQWDASTLSKGAADNIGPITAYVEDDGLGKSTYKLTLVGNGSGKIYANEDSSYAFSVSTYNKGFTKITAFNGAEILDTSRVNNMSYMFYYAGYNLGYNSGSNARTLDLGNLSSWDTSNVTDMSYMFYGAGRTATTFDIGGFSSWDTSNVTTMSNMFFWAGQSATTWNIGDLSGWDTANVTDMSSMFSNAGQSATTFDIGNLSGWNTAKVTDMSKMFNYAGRAATTWNIGDLSGWDVLNVTNMSSMFSNAGYTAKTWNVGDLSGWDVLNVTNMSNMFDSAGFKTTTFNIGNLSSWDTSKVTTMSNMFNYAGYSATVWNIGDLSSWKTSNVTDMSNMFHYAGYSATTWNIGDLSGWKTSNVTNMLNMFKYVCYKATTFDIGNLSEWDTANVTNMSGMFCCAGNNATTWNIGDLSGWDVLNVTTMSNMFNYAGYKATIFDIGDLKDWKTSNVTNMSSLFGCAGYTAKTFDIGDLNDWDTSKVTTMLFMFNHAGSKATTWNIGDLSGWDTSNVTDMGSMFSYAGQNATTWNIGDLSGWDTSNVTTMSSMFSYAGYKATTFDIGNLSDWDTANVTTMSYMFCCAGYKATTWNIGDLSDWDTGNVTNMSTMFQSVGYSATTLDIGDLSEWNTSKVTDMGSMFCAAGYNSTPITLDLSGWDTSKVTNMSNMFLYMNRLHTIILGENFSTTGDGTVTDFALPTIDTSYFTESDGLWYDVATKTGYAPDAIPTNTAATYSVDKDATPIIKVEVPGLGDVTVNDPDAEMTYDPDTGNLGGEIPPSEDEPEPTPDEIPEEELPELISVAFGNFKSKSTYTPGTYEDVTYEQSYTRNKYPVTYGNTYWSQWKVTKDADGNVISTEPGDIQLENIEKTYSTWIVYDFETEKYLESNGVKGDTVEIWTIFNSSEDTLENAVYLAAYLNKLDGKTSRHIAKHDGTNYVAYDADAQISAVKTFTETYVVTGTKRVEITEASTTTEYVYVPLGELRAEKGMTWAKWLESDYNTTGETTPTIKTSDFVDVAYTDVIDENLEYGFFAYELSGTWMFNEDIFTEKILLEDASQDEFVTLVQDIEFTSAGTAFQNIEIVNSLGIQRKYTINTQLNYDTTTAANGNYTQMDDGYVEGTGTTWADEEYRTLDFGETAQSVSKEFYDWFTANASQQVYELEGTWYLNDTVEWFDTTYNFEFMIPNFTSETTFIGFNGTILNESSSSGLTSVIQQPFITSDGKAYYWPKTYVDEVRTWEVLSTINEVTDTIGSTTAGKDLYDWFCANATKQ